VVRGEKLTDADRARLKVLGDASDAVDPTVLAQTVTTAQAPGVADNHNSRPALGPDAVIADTNLMVALKFTDEVHSR
jgi:hypothetical protein